MKVPELYFSIADLCALFRFSDSTVRTWVRKGKFSPPGADGQPDLSNVLNIDGDLRVPASGVNLFTGQHALRYDLGVKARNKAELRRKLAGQKPVASQSEASEASKP